MPKNVDFLLGFVRLKIRGRDFIKRLALYSQITEPQIIKRLYGMSGHSGILSCGEFLTGNFSLVTRKHAKV